MKKFFLPVLAALCLIISGSTISSGASTFNQGDIVFAEWVVNGWYHGTVGDECGDGSYMILFDDGDTKCCNAGLIVKDVIPSASNALPGKEVLALWSDGKYYPGTIGVISDGYYYIRFNDGDKGKVTLDQLRLRD